LTIHIVLTKKDSLIIIIKVKFKFFLQAVLMTYFG
jgi:hypothetical protein